MPLVRVQTSTAVDEAARAATMKSLSWSVAEILQKPESYVMVILEPEVPMLFSALPDPAAFVEVRSVGTISGGRVGTTAFGSNPWRDPRRKSRFNFSAPRAAFSTSTSPSSTSIHRKVSWPRVQRNSNNDRNDPLSWQDRQV